MNAEYSLLEQHTPAPAIPPFQAGISGMSLRQIEATAQDAARAAEAARLGRQTVEEADRQHAAEMEEVERQIAESKKLLSQSPPREEPQEEHMLTAKLRRMREDIAEQQRVADAVERELRGTPDHHMRSAVNKVTATMTLAEKTQKANQIRQREILRIDHDIEKHNTLEDYKRASHLWEMRERVAALDLSSEAEVDTLLEKGNARYLERSNAAAEQKNRQKKRDCCGAEQQLQARCGWLIERCCRREQRRLDKLQQKILTLGKRTKPMRERMYLAAQERDFGLAAQLKREVALLMVESARYERQLAQLQLRIAMDNQEQPGQDDGLADRIGSGDEGQGGGKPGGILCSIHLRTVFVSGRQILK